METEVEFPSLQTPAIIAMKGLPLTRKKSVAASIAKWARCPILIMEHFVEDLYKIGGANTGQSLPSHEAERLYLLAFEILCKVAASQKRALTNVNCVVIKARLCSTFELDRLIQLAKLQDPSKTPQPLIIIECKMRNEYLWQEGFVKSNYEYVEQYRPMIWKEIEKVGHGYDAQAWDCHFHQSIMQLPVQNQHLVRRLVLDPYNDLSVNQLEMRQMDRRFADAIKFLLTGTSDELRELSPVMEFDQLRRFLLEKELKNAPRERSKFLCTSQRGCVFKYWEALEDYVGANCHCRACEKQVSGPGYACHFCTLALHASCAEMIDISEFVYLDDEADDESERYPFPETHACDSCKEGGKDFSYECKSCIFQTHLKCRLMPTIFKHECHLQHFLSIQLASKASKSPIYTCRACGHYGFFTSYVCKICNYSYHLRCLSWPREIKHEHGGYEHVMKLMYSIDEEHDEEDFWCNVCYKEMNRQAWFYTCLECDYVAHMEQFGVLTCGAMEALTSMTDMFLE